MIARACCCGHMNWEHRGGDGMGPCRACGASSCAKFHRVGEGNSVKPLAVVLAWSITLAALWWRWAR